MFSQDSPLLSREALGNRRVVAAPDVGLTQGLATREAHDDGHRALNASELDD